jgi:hypothetical protein
VKPLLFALCALLTAFPADSRAKARCHSQCFQCRVRCKQRASDVEACTQTCLELKRQCCQAAGHGLGPRTTCDCT